jgi:hypothetical protein
MWRRRRDAGRLFDIHTESALRRASRDFRALATNTVRFLLWAAAVNAVVVGSTVWLSWGHHEAASILIGVGALVVGTALAFLIPFSVLLAVAPYRQRNEARRGLVRAHQEAHQETERHQQELEDLRAEKQLQSAAPLFGTELRDIRTKIEKVKADGSYPMGFKLPAFRWNDHARDLTGRPDIYRIVERGYTAAHQVNERLDAREAKRRPGNRALLPVQPRDGLDEAHGAAGEALDALGEPHNES